MGRRTPEPRTSPGHKLTIRVRFVNAGLLWAGQQEQVTKRLQEEADNDQDDGELRDLSGCANEAEERVRAAYQDNRHFKVQVVGELMPAQKSKADRPVTIVVSVLEIDVNEGSVFHWGDLQVEGMTEADKRETAARWDGSRGQVYASNPHQALDKFFAMYFRPLRAWITPSDYAKWRIDERESTADVYLSLVPNPSLLKYIPKSWRSSPTNHKSNP